MQVRYQLRHTPEGSLPSPGNDEDSSTPQFVDHPLGQNQFIVLQNGLDDSGRC